jgi:hypothetical protein
MRIDSTDMTVDDVVNIILSGTEKGAGKPDPFLK